MALFVTIKFRESMTNVMKAKHKELLERIPDLPFASNWEHRSPDLHMVCIDDPANTFRNSVNAIFRGYDVFFQTLDNYRAADIVHRFLKGYKKNRDRQDKAYRQKHNLKPTTRNNIAAITWANINEESKKNITRLIKRYRK